MATPTATSYFNTLERTRSTTLSPSPSASPSPFANSQPQCIHDIGAITAQLLSEDGDIRTKCLALIYNGKRRCKGSFESASTPQYLVEASKVLLGTTPISAEKFGKSVMRILFCKTHDKSGPYKRLLGCFYEQHQSWKGDNSPAELEFLRAIRQIFNFSLVQSPEEINTTPVRLASDIPLRPAPPTTCDAECSAFDLDSSMSNEAKEGATCDPEVCSQCGMADAGGEVQGGLDIQESLPMKNATRSDHQPQLDEGHVDSETITDQADMEVAATTVYLSADIFSLSTRGLQDLKSEANGGQKELNSCKDIPNISVCNEFVQTPHASRTTRNDALPSPSSQARSQELSLVTERFFELDREERHTGLCCAEGSPTPEPTSGRMTRKGTPARNSVNANERIQANIKKSVTKAGYIYILKAPQYFAKERPGQMPLVKIGMSVHPDTRIKEIKSSCDIEDLERVLDIEDSSCRNYYKIEKLVHDELAEYNQRLTCTGKHRTKKDVETEHREWFAVSETVALQTVQRWRRFMEQNPYDGRGILKDVWSKMIKKKDFQREGDEDCDEHEKRHRYWTRWLDEGIRAAAEEGALRNSGVKAAEAPTVEAAVALIDDGAAESSIVKLLRHLFSRLLKTKLAHGFRLLLGTLSLGV